LERVHEDRHQSRFEYLRPGEGCYHSMVHCAAHVVATQRLQHSAAKVQALH
jgi:hypothetical protein